MSSIASTLAVQALPNPNFGGGYSLTLSARKISQLALIAIGTYAVLNVPTASGGLISGFVTLGGCIGAGVLFPASFWVAAPCYELAMLATANPLLP